MSNNGCWVVWSFVDERKAESLHAVEIDALREAVKKDGWKVKFIPFGTHLDEALASTEEWTPEDEQPIPLYPTDTPTGKTPEELILDRITLPEQHDMGPHS
jgi:hypothetical protein